jgi:hypothetical protein
MRRLLSQGARTVQTGPGANGGESASPEGTGVAGAEADGGRKAGAARPSAAGGICRHVERAVRALFYAGDAPVGASRLLSWFQGRMKS